MFLPESEGAGFVQLEVPPDPANPASFQDLETMEVVLAQYGVLHDMEGPLVEKDRGAAELSDTKYGPDDRSGTSELKGRLVLMDEDDGEVVATLDEAVQIKEDISLAAVGHQKDPVVVDLPGDEHERAGRTQAYAHPASPEEHDMLMKTAGLIRCVFSYQGARGSRPIRPGILQSRYNSNHIRNHNWHDFRVELLHLPFDAHQHTRRILASHAR